MNKKLKKHEKDGKGFSICDRKVTLKAHRQISKKRCFEKYFSCDEACQFSAL